VSADRVLLGAATDALAREAEAQIALLTAAAAWGEAHVAGADDWSAVPAAPHTIHGDTDLGLAGPGAPRITEFSTYELAAALGWSTEATKSLLGEALELKHRLPRLWQLTVEERRVPVRIARHIASCTLDLSLDAAKDADRLVCADPRQVGKVRAKQLVDQIRLWHDPDRAVDDEQRALANRGVWLRETGNPATTEVLMVLDGQDARHLDQTLNQLAGELQRLGDEDSRDVRRAKAVGSLTDPQLALDLLDGTASELPTRRPPAVQLFLHLSEEALTGSGPVVIERLGAATRDLVRDWLTDAKVIVRPVLDLHRDDAVDTHQPPDWMRELVVQRDASCAYPGCARDSRGCDLDHIEPYVEPDDGGPPGQTSSDNLAPLCRRHHRAKTHGRFDYRRQPDGSYRWTLPSGLVLIASSGDRRTV